jgi:hypothetical protein
MAIAMFKISKITFTITKKFESRLSKGFKEKN